MCAACALVAECDDGEEERADAECDGNERDDELHDVGVVDEHDALVLRERVALAAAGRRLLDERHFVVAGRHLCEFKLGVERGRRQRRRLAQRATVPLEGVQFGEERKAAAVRDVQLLERVAFAVEQTDGQWHGDRAAHRTQRVVVGRRRNGREAKRKLGREVQMHGVRHPLVGARVRAGLDVDARHEVEAAAVDRRQVPIAHARRVAAQRHVDGGRAADVVRFRAHLHKFELVLHRALRGRVRGAGRLHDAARHGECGKLATRQRMAAAADAQEDEN